MHSLSYILESPPCFLVRILLEATSDYLQYARGVATLTRLPRGPRGYSKQVGRRRSAARRSQSSIRWRRLRLGKRAPSVSRRGPEMELLRIQSDQGFPPDALLSPGHE